MTLGGFFEYRICFHHLGGIEAPDVRLTIISEDKVLRGSMTWIPRKADYKIIRGYDIYAVG